jgi:hypothetical protein
LCFDRRFFLGADGLDIFSRSLSDPAAELVPTSAQARVAILGSGFKPVHLGFGQILQISFSSRPSEEGSDMRAVYPSPHVPPRI